MFRARRKRSREVSLYEPIGTDREGNEISLLDIIESPPVDVVDDCFKKDSISYLLRYIRTVLSPKEYQVICCRYGLNGQEPLTQREIAENLSISRSYVSRIEKNALRKLRTLFLKSVKGRTFFSFSPLLSYPPFRIIHLFGEYQIPPASQSVSHRSSAEHVVHSP